MIKYNVLCDTRHKDENSNVAWVTKRKITKPNSESYIGLSFHKLTPRIKESFLKSKSEDSASE